MLLANHQLLDVGNAPVPVAVCDEDKARTWDEVIEIDLAGESYLAGR